MRLSFDPLSSREKAFRPEEIDYCLEGFVVSSHRSDLRLRAPFGFEPKGRRQVKEHSRSRSGKLTAPRKIESRTAERAGPSASSEPTLIDRE